MSNCPCCSPPWAFESNLGISCPPAVRVSLGCTGSPTTDLCGTVASCTYESAPRSPQRIYRPLLLPSSVADAVAVTRKYTAARISDTLWEVKAWYGGRTVSPFLSYIHVGTYRGTWNGRGSGTLALYWDILDPVSDAATQTLDFYTATSNLHWWTAACDEESSSCRTAMQQYPGPTHFSSWRWNGSAWQKWIDAPTGYAELESEFAPTTSGTSVGQMHKIPFSGIWSSRTPFPASITITALSGPEAPNNPACQYSFLDDGCSGTVEWQVDDMDETIAPPINSVCATRWYSGIDYALAAIGATGSWVKHGGSWYANRVPSGLGTNFEEPVAASSKWIKFAGAWDSGTAYLQYEAVIDDDRFWFAHSNVPAGLLPPSDPSSSGWNSSDVGFTGPNYVTKAATVPSVDPCVAPCRERPATPLVYTTPYTYTTPCDNPRIV